MSSSVSCEGCSQFASMGSGWKERLQYYVIGESEGNYKNWTNDQMEAADGNLTGFEFEEIEEVFVYYHKLCCAQVTTLIFRHDLVVFRTKTWYWSIEKNAEIIIIQRSDQIEYVRDKYRGTPRKDAPRRSDGPKSGTRTVQDLVNWLYAEKELSNCYCYNVWSKNCQGFASKVFAFCTKPRRAENNVALDFERRGTLPLTYQKDYS